MDTTGGTNTQLDDTAIPSGEQARLASTFRNLLDRVKNETRERPLVALAAASGLGFALGRGLPRFRAVAALFGVGGLVGYAVTVLRERSKAADDSSETDAADTSDDAHDIHVSSSLPDASHPRRET